MNNFSILILVIEYLLVLPPIYSVSSQLAHDVVAALGFGCILVAASDNVVTTLSHCCVSDVVTTTKNQRCNNVVFSTSVFRPGINVKATS